MTLLLKRCRTLPGRVPRLLAWFLLFLLPVFFPVLFYPVLGGWLAGLVADRFLWPAIRRGQSLTLAIDIPPVVEYRSRFALALRWELPASSAADRQAEIICYPGADFQPGELRFSSGFQIKRLRARKKGRFILNRWYLKVNSRFGFFSLWYPLDLSAVITVQNPLRRLEQKIRWGAENHDRQGGELEFHSLRQYRPGDRVKQINWKKTAGAHNHEIFLNLFEQEKYRRVLFLLHTGMAVNYRWRTEDFLDYNIALLLALAATVLHSHDQAGLVTFSNQVHRVIEPAAGLAQLQRFRETLATVRSDGKTMPAPVMLSALTRYIRPGTQVIVLQPLTTAAEAEHFLPVVRHWRQQARILWVSARRVAQIATTEPALSHWQQQQQHIENATIKRILTGVGSSVIRARPEDCYRELLTAWQRQQMT